MATALAGVSLSPARIAAKAEAPKCPKALKTTWNKTGSRFFPAAAARGVHVRRLAATPDRIAEKVQESIKKAEETCAEDAATGECAAAWDEVEEVSAAASHARERAKETSDPLENYCKENPETVECKTFDD
ncbi:hypothetical protein ACLOJK_017638 [Asimina triloba]